MHKTESNPVTQQDLEILSRKGAKNRPARNKAIARIAHRLGYLPSPTFRGRKAKGKKAADPNAWNKTIDYLDEHYPLWRGYPVEYVPSNREVA